MTNDECLLTDVEFVAFDLETTGCSADTCEIVEIGAVRFRWDGTELGRFRQLVDPCCSIPAVVTRIHGITDAMVRGEPTLEAALPALSDFFDTAPAVGLAHNAPFDVGFLNRGWARFRLTPPTLPVLDSVWLARRRCRGLGRYTLETLARHYRIGERVEHRALADSLVLKDVFLALMREPAAPATLAELQRLAPTQSFRAIAARRPRGITYGSSVNRTPIPDGFAALEQAALERRVVSLLYHSASSGSGRRSVTPRKFVQLRGTMYLLAFCHVDRKEKQYRLDRIQEFQVEGDPD